MNDFYIYILKSSAALALFYGIYHFFLQDEKFYNAIRLYLGSSLILSFILPLIKVKYEVVTASENSDFLLMINPFVQTHETNANTPLIENISLIQIILGLYILICLYMLAKAIFRIISTQNIIKDKTYDEFEGHKLIKLTDDTPSFSFLGKIIINSKDYNTNSFKNILAHEKVHVEQKHWIDLLLVELTTILLWFNPFAWLFERAIKQTHELLADEGVIAQGCNIGEYQASILNQIMGVEVMGLANNFNCSITKKRMIMMTKDNQSDSRKLRFLYIFPAIAALLALNLQVVNVAQAQTNEVVTITKKSEKVKIEGTLLNNDNKPVANYSVLLFKMKDTNSKDAVNIKGVFVARTNSQGKFSATVQKNTVVRIFNGKEEVITRNIDDFILNGKKQGDTYCLTLKSQQYLESGKKGNRAKRFSSKKDVFVVVEDMPEFPGGDNELQKWIARNIKYPEAAAKKGIVGRVYVGFVVNKKGGIEDIKIMRGAEASLDAEAMRVIGTMPKWKPGKQNGKIVKVQYTIPINFALNK
ncbi:TonB family protein [Ancylomarina sp. YFZ004]